MSKVVWDISDNNWDKMYDAPKKSVYGVIMKVSEGESSIDSQAEKVIKYIRGKGLKVGGYHWACFSDSVSGAHTEATHAIKSAKSAGLKAGEPLALDFETGHGDDYNEVTAGAYDAIVAFLDDVKSAGFQPLLYGGAGVLFAKIKHADIVKKYGSILWVASYGSAKPGMKGLAIWQWSDGNHGGEDGTDNDKMYVDVWDGDTQKADPSTIPSWIFKRKMTAGQLPTPWSTGSHIGKYAYDISIPGTQHIPYYAPVDMKCELAINNNTGSNTHVYTSLKKVQFADGHTDHLTISCMHDDNPIHSKGDVIKQGEVLGHTGCTEDGYQSLGTGDDHLHIEIGIGTFSGKYYNLPYNETHNPWGTSSSEYPGYYESNGNSESKGWTRDPGWKYQGKRLPAGSMYMVDVFFADPKVFPDGVVIDPQPPLMPDGYPKGDSKELKLKLTSEALSGTSDDDDDDDNPGGTITKWHTIVRYHPWWY